MNTFRMYIPDLFSTSSGWVIVQDNQIIIYDTIQP